LEWPDPLLIATMAQIHDDLFPNVRLRNNFLAQQ
jgi:hypothetical protein